MNFFGHAADRAALDSIVWEGDAHDLRVLVGRLEHLGIPEGYRDADTLSRAVVRALSRRPRLALDPPGAALLEAEMPDLRERVLTAGPRLLRDLRASLESR